MPYKLSSEGYKLLHPLTPEQDLRMQQELKDLTDLQKKAVEYFCSQNTRWIDAHEVATFYGYPNGMYFRGVLASLHKKGLLDKEEE